MDIPESLVIDGLHWQVSECEISEHDYGETVKTECVIRISRRPAHQLRRQTFWHELIHALVASRDLPFDCEDEERIATLLGPALDSFFQANADIRWRTDLDGGRDDD